MTPNHFLTLLNLRKHLRRQTNFILILQQIHSQILQRCIRPLQINNPHTHIQNWQNSAHQILSIGQLLQLLPLRLTFLLLLHHVVFFFRDARFHPSDLFVTAQLALLDTLDEVVGFEDCAVGVHFHHVHIHELFVGEDFTRYEVTHIYDARFGWVSVVVEENVLGVVVGLINH